MVEKIEGAVSEFHGADTLSGQAIMRAVWSLIDNPMEDPTSERRYVERFVKPGFVR